MKVIDLTYTLSSDTPSWDGDCGFTLTNEVDYKDCTPPDLFRVQKVEMRAGMGTHMDAPAHCFEGAKTIEALELSDLITDCVVIDVSKEAGENYVAMPEAIVRFENEHGMIPQNAFVIFYTGWSKHWNDKEKYRNNLQFPSVHEDTAKLLLERNIAGLGIDTLSSDVGNNKNGFPVHRAILGAGKYLVENIANAGELPPTGSKIYVLPIKIKEGTEAPIRLVAIL
jgi:kynurenine formamidase